VLPVGEPVLQREVVGGEHGRALVQAAVTTGGVDHHRVQPPREARALGERHEFAIEIRGTADEVVNRGVARRAAFNATWSACSSHQSYRPGARHTVHEARRVAARTSPLAQARSPSTTQRGHSDTVRYAIG